MTTPPAVLFDLDGTLIDSRDYWFGVLCEASRHFGGRTVERSVFEATFGQAAADDIRAFYPSAALDDVDAFYAAAVPRHAHRMRAVDGMAVLLDALRGRGVRLACATNSPSAFTRAALEATLLRSRLETVACVDEVDTPKPAPDVIVLAARRLGMHPAQCVMVGDSRFDVLAARAAGCRVIGLGIDADERAESAEELARLLGVDG